MTRRRASPSATRASAAVAFWLLVSAATGTSYHATIVVNRTDDPNPAGLACNGVAEDCSLRAAVIKANSTSDADTITLPAGTYTLSIPSTDDEYNFNGAIAATGDIDVYNGGLTINGAGSGVTIIQAAPNAIVTPIDRIFDVENVYGSPSSLGLAFTVTGVTLRYGAAPTLTTPDGPFPEVGGAINFDGCQSTGLPCTSQGTLTLTDVQFVSNSSPVSGGGLFHLGSLNDGNITITAGGLNTSTFTTNTSPGSGGAMRLGMVGGVVTITNTTFTSNTSGAGTPFGGGAISVENGRNITINGGSFVTNTAVNHGGAIYFDGLNDDVMTLSRVDLRANTADFGNDGIGDGGAVFLAGGELRFAGCLVRDNVAVNGAGAATGSTYGNPRLTIRNTTLNGNLAKTLGGAVFVNNSASSANTATLTNVTVVGNRANTASAGGSSFGGGLARSNGPLALQNTITSGNFRGPTGNTADDGKATTGVTANFSLIENTTNFSFSGGSNVTGVSPSLGPLQDNGGGLLTYALLINSPALDAGSNSLATAASLTTDQRGTGFGRTRDSADADATATVDIGAYEAHPVIADIGNATMEEDTVAPLVFNVGDDTAGFSAASTSSNTALIVNAALVITGTGSTRTLTMTPVANAWGTATITVTLSAIVSGALQQMSDTFVLTVLPVGDIPAVSATTFDEDTQSTSGLVLTRHAVDGVEITHFKMTGITSGLLFKNDGVTAINNNDFITFAEANAGLKFTSSANAYTPANAFSFTAAGARSAIGAGLGLGGVPSITVTPIADAPTISAAATDEDTQSSTALVIARNAVDGTEITHFKITNITNGTLFKNNGTTSISNDAFITFAEGNAGLKFTPSANGYSPGTSFTFTAAGATSGSGAGLGVGTAATIVVSPVAEAPGITAATTTEDTQSSAGLVISRHGADSTEVTHFKITGILNGLLFKNDGSTAIQNNDFITFGEANAGLKFTPAANAFSPGTSFAFTAAGATSAGGTGLGPGTAATIAVTPIADAPTITASTTNEDTQTSSGLVIGRNAADSTEVTHFKITGITNGTLFKNNGTSQIVNDDVITFAEGNAGLKFSPAANAFSPGTAFAFTAAGATSAGGAGLSAGTAVSIAVTPIADTPSITGASTATNVQTTSGLVAARNAADGAEVTHFKITGVVNGALFKNNGTTPINVNDIITFAEGNAGLKFTPAAGKTTPGDAFSVSVQGATTAGGAGLSGTATGAVLVFDPPAITAQPQSQVIQTGNQASLSVTATGSSLTYQWYAGTSGTTTAAVSGATSASYTTPALSATTNYWVRVSNGGGNADSQTATVEVVLYVPFTDNTLEAGVTPLKAVHITELRSRVNAQRQRFNLAAFVWTDATLTVNSTGIRGIHVTEMRAALLAAYSAAGVTPPTFTDSTLTAGSTAIKAIHIQQLRDAVIALELR